MKYFKSFIFIAALFLLLVGPVSAQLIDAGTVQDFASDVGREAGYAPVEIGYVISVLLRAFLGLLALIFIILMVLAGFRWMNSGGNEETIKKSQATIKNSLIGLLLVLAAWAITYFIFNALPFASPGGGLQGGTSG